MINKPPNQHFSNDEERNIAALKYLDMLYPFFPDYDSFQINHQIHAYSKKVEISADELSRMNEVRYQIEIILTGENMADTAKFGVKLNEKGREVKRRGGYSKYQEWLNKQQQIQEETSTLSLQNLKKSIDELDRRFLDYEETKNIATTNKNAAVVAATAAVIAAIAAMIPWLCNK